MWATSGASGRHLVMDFDEETPITLEFPEEPPLELTDDDVIDERPIVTLH